MSKAGNSASTPPEPQSSSPHTPPPADAAAGSILATIPAQHAPGRWRGAREWGGLIVGGIALALSAFGLARDADLKERQVQLEVEGLLAEAWDLLGGRPGTEAITAFNSDSADLAVARRLIENQALVLDPSYAKSHRYLGTYWSAMGQTSTAIACFRKAIALEPESAPAHSNLGIALRKQGDPEGAISSYRRAIALQPQEAVLHYNLGNALGDLGDHEGAIAAYQQAISLKPDYAPAHFNLGVSLETVGDLEGALASFVRVLDLTPNDADAVDYLSMIQEKMKAG